VSVTCPCVKAHSPKPAYLQKHHILPQAWGGQTTPLNLISICGTCHDTAHFLMNKLVRAGKWVSLDGYSPFAAKLAIRAVQEHIKLYSAWPARYTVAHPTGDDHADARFGMEAEGRS
jgi:hypothetical protein